MAANVVTGSVVTNALVAVASHPAGTLPFGPFTLPPGLSELGVFFDLQQVQSLTAVFTFTWQLSLDNGATFQDLPGMSLDLSKSGFVLNGNVLTRSAQDALGPGPVRYGGRRMTLAHTDSLTRVIQGTVSCSEGLISGVTLTGL